jgi:hypothetical protein
MWVLTSLPSGSGHWLKPEAKRHPLKRAESPQSNHVESMSLLMFSESAASRRRAKALWRRRAAGLQTWGDPAAFRQRIFVSVFEADTGDVPEWGFRHDNGGGMHRCPSGSASVVSVFEADIASGEFCVWGQIASAHAHTRAPHWPREPRFSGPERDRRKA